MHSVTGWSPKKILERTDMGELFQYRAIALESKGLDMEATAPRSAGSSETREILGNGVV